LAKGKAGEVDEPRTGENTTDSLSFGLSRTRFQYRYAKKAYIVAFLSMTGCTIKKTMFVARCSLLALSLVAHSVQSTRSSGTFAVFAFAASEDVDQDQVSSRELSTNTLTFSYTGSAQSWVVPIGVDTFTIDAYGAAGGDKTCSGCSTYAGGLGGYISVSNIAASSFVGQTLFIYVGGAGAYNTAPGLGGGGGQASGDSGYYSSGGGATDVRTVLNDLSTRYDGFLIRVCVVCVLLFVKIDECVCNFALGCLCVCVGVCARITAKKCNCL